VSHARRSIERFVATHPLKTSAYQLLRSQSRRSARPLVEVAARRVYTVALSDITDRDELSNSPTSKVPY